MEYSYKKYNLITTFKLWLYYKLSSWYINHFIFDEDDWVKGNIRFREAVALKIYQDFGEKCKELNLSCSCCQANLAKDILYSLYWDDEEKPPVYNKCRENK